MTGLHSRLEHRCLNLRRIGVLRQSAAQKTDCPEGCKMETRKGKETTQITETAAGISYTLDIIDLSCNWVTRL